MAMPKTAARLLAEELCAKYPEHSNLGLAKRLRTEHPECFASVEKARSMIRIIRGATGKRARPHATQIRPKGKAGTKPKCPPSFEEAWTPFDLGSGIKIGVLSDAHIPYHVSIAVESAVEHLKKQKPDVVFMGIRKQEKDANHATCSMQGSERLSITQISVFFC